MKQHVLVTASQQDDISNDANIADSQSDNINNQQQQMDVQKSLQLQHQRIKERQERLQQIEVDVVDINKIMHELHSMVNVQGESISKYFKDFYLNNPKSVHCIVKCFFCNLN